MHHAGDSREPELHADAAYDHTDANSNHHSGDRSGRARNGRGAATTGVHFYAHHDPDDPHDSNVPDVPHSSDHRDASDHPNAAHVPDTSDVPDASDHSNVADLSNTSDVSDDHRDANVVSDFRRHLLAAIRCD